MVRHAGTDLKDSHELDHHDGTAPNLKEARARFDNSLLFIMPK